MQDLFRMEVLFIEINTLYIIITHRVYYIFHISQRKVMRNFLNSKLQAGTNLKQLSLTALYLVRENEL